MGSLSSKAAPVACAGSVVWLQEDEVVLDRFDLSPPSAAVIGAGLSGVHAAYELAKLGFQVTVFDTNAGVAMGETEFALPFVGIGLPSPYIPRLSVRRDLLRSLLLPKAIPDIISRDNAWLSTFSPQVHRWLWARYWDTTSLPTAHDCAAQLSRLSVNVIEELVQLYPSLQKQVLRLNSPSPLHARATLGATANALAADVASASFQSTPDNEMAAPSVYAELHSNSAGRRTLTPVPTAHEAPFAIRPVEWTRELARICRDSFGVQFALGERVVDIHTHLHHNVEVVSGLRTRSPRTDATGEQVFEYHERRFDIVVLAAGAKTGQLTRGTSQLPIIGLRGWRMSWRGDSAVPPPVAGAESAKLAPLQALAPSVGMVSLVSQANLVSHSSPLTAESTLQGLMSFDTSDDVRQSALAFIWERFQAYLRVHHDIELGGTPSVPQRQEQPVATADPHEGAGATEVDMSLHATTYTRGYTPDGLPVVSQCGSTFNQFVCSGFGDHVADFAPGSARLLAQIVRIKAQQYRRETELSLLPETELALQVAHARDEVVHPLAETSLLQALLREPGEEGAVASLPVLRMNPDTRACNPLSAARFNGLVKDELTDVTYVSPWNRFTNFEDRVVQWTEKWKKDLNARAVAYACGDGVSDWVRSFIFTFFFDDADDAELQRWREVYVKGLQRILVDIERHHVVGPTTDAAVGTQPATK